MRWLQLVGSIKLWVSVAEATNNFVDPTNQTHPILYVCPMDV